jgi:pathogenesis-related protein 1
MKKVMVLVSMALFGLLTTGCDSSNGVYMTDAPMVVDNSKENKFYLSYTSDNTNLYRDVTIDSQFSKQSLLDAHNKAREDVGVMSKYTWSDTISRDAQRYADEMALSGVWEHDAKNHTGYANGPYGEKLVISKFKPTYSFATKALVDEKEFYHYGKIGDEDTCDTGKVCGHYTQVVWERSREVGCAVSRYVTGQHKDWYIIVCKYQEPGNYLNETPY